MSQTKIVSFKFIIFIIIIFCSTGCSDKNKQPTVSTVIHPENWINDHKTGYRAYTARTMCTNCHGIDGKGGNSHVSCFSTSYLGQSCHAEHPTGWKDPVLHGLAAKSSPDTTSVLSGYGFSRCQKCHGNEDTTNFNFAGGIVNISCFACHGVSAPHPRAPWRDSDTTDINPSPRKHYRSIDTSSVTLSVCVVCHAKGNYSHGKYKQDTSATIPAALGCRNNTICHR